MKGKTIRYILVAGFFVLLGTFLSPILFHATDKGLQLLQADSKREVSPAKRQAISLEMAFEEVFDS
ncbi:MAG: serine protease, partial [Leptospiraceae bacterium]|nr:serine protease [Leptospiraceae bacterium]